MSREMLKLKPLQNRTGHPKKTIPQNDSSQTCKTIRGTLNEFHHCHRQEILTPTHIRIMEKKLESSILYITGYTCIYIYRYIGFRVQG